MKTLRWSWPPPNKGRGKKRRLPRWALAVLLLAAAWALLRFTPLPFDPTATKDSAAFLASDGSLLRLRLSPDGTYRLPLPLEEVSPQVVKGFIE